MELVDDSLTNILESSLQPLPYHIQVNLCHDVGECIARSLALSSTKPGALWRRICNVPVRYSSYVSLRGQLLAVGGLDVHTETMSPVYVYEIHPAIQEKSSATWQHHNNSAMQLSTLMKG